MPRRGYPDRRELDNGTRVRGVTPASGNGQAQQLQKLSHAELVKLADAIIEESSRRLEAKHGKRLTLLEVA